VDDLLPGQRLRGMFAPTMASASVSENDQSYLKQYDVRNPAKDDL
jgi:hypothetical protein